MKSEIKIQHRFNCFKFNCLKNINSIDTTMVISEQVNSVAFALIRLNIHHSLCVWKYDSLCVCVHLLFVPAVRRAHCFLWPELITCTTTIPDNQWKKDSCNPVNSPGSCSFSRLSSQCLIYFQYLYPRQMLRLFNSHTVSGTPSAGSFNSSVASLYLLTFITGIFLAVYNNNYSISDYVFV